LGVLDFLDALFGQPGWTRDHRLAWDGFTSPGPSGLTRFQQMLQGRIEEALLQAGFTVGQWERSPSEEAGAIHADIAGTGLRIWLDRNAAAFGRTIKRGRVVPDRVYEEWGSRTPLKSGMAQRPCSAFMIIRTRCGWREAIAHWPSTAPGKAG
jgi:hypothetical protein